MSTVISTRKTSLIFIFDLKVQERLTWVRICHVMVIVFADVNGIRFIIRPMIPFLEPTTSAYTRHKIMKTPTIENNKASTVAITMATVRSEHFRQLKLQPGA